MALAIAALVTRWWRRGSPALAFLGVAAVVTGLFAFGVSPYPGPPRSWGLYVPFGVCVTVLGAWWLAQQLSRGVRFKALALGAVVISLIHVLPPLSVSKQVEMAAERLSWLVTAPSPWDVRGRANALEQMGAFYLIAGDTLLAAEQLKEAWRMRPNPLYLGAAGTYYTGIKRYDLAEEQFSTLVEARPLDREANLSLGIVKALNGRLDEARQYLLIAYGDTSLTLPEPVIDTPYWVDLPHGPEREEIRERRMGMRKNSQETFEVGEEAFRKGDLPGAERLYKRALEIYPNWGRMQYEVYCHVGTIYGMRGQTKEAAFEFLRAINSYRNYPLCYFIENGVGYGPARYTAEPHRGGDAVSQGG
jgi:tetratricopeptide (TPR) repeat protein